MLLGITPGLELALLDSCRTPEARVRVQERRDHRTMSGIGAGDDALARGMDKKIDFLSLRLSQAPDQVLHPTAPCLVRSWSARVPRTSSTQAGEAGDMHRWDVEARAVVPAVGGRRSSGSAKNEASGGELRSGSGDPGTPRPRLGRSSQDGSAIPE